MGSRQYSVGGIEVACTGRLVRVARLRSEYHVCLEAPETFISQLSSAGVRADLFTFVQGLDDLHTRHPYPFTSDRMAVLEIETFDVWWKKQLNDKTRNMIRKAQRSGVKVRSVPFSKELVKEIKSVYDETPTRQGQVNTHYGKDLPTIEREHSSFLDRAEFIGAYLGEELIGFAKVVFVNKYATLLNIVAMVSQRDKAPSNGLMARIVEVCIEHGCKFLMYAGWHGPRLRRFKESNGFKCFDVPRYYVPLTLKGRIALAMGLHRPFLDRLNEDWRDRLSELRFEWESFRNRRLIRSAQRTAQSAERLGRNGIRDASGSSKSE